MSKPETGISTSWLGDSPRGAEEIIRHIEALGEVDGVEINYRITGETFNKLIRALKSLGLKIFSLHNFTPIPSDIPFHRASGDLYNLASRDPFEREAAVKNTARTIELAHELEGPAVVLHCGRVDMEAEWDRIRKWMKEGKLESEEVASFVKQKLNERNGLADSHLDGLLLSLDELANLADRYSVTLGIENRYSFHEMPQEKELLIIFEKLRGAPLAYWHDTGHFHVNRVLKILNEEIWLNQIFPNTAGCHVHDVIGVDDHLPIGEGESDFQDIRAITKSRPDIPLILELKAGLEDGRVKESLERLKEMINRWKEQENQGE
ncbi:sugar phosphate isomerase/epimerase family protein [Thermodesulforhabdus norvegica]|uniref:Sugar phosphate isomerase/epimerase n=1 Tax=Thermodesulforhabdus norvegica TaxID=39841 RepID=A0A1I4U9W9_9BACT|nr:TIM barrel protein [Thermodesulforhabdus norvegica]SFM85523.1 Sugar phosphate isomerase/epimerase [Thermodesulforhabdus norvegica]